MRPFQFSQDSSNRPLICPPASEAVVRLEFLDALRGLAAVWVVLFHVNVTLKVLMKLTGATPDWGWFTKFGLIGVMLFFVVSAFSLTYTMQLHSDRSAAAFYIRRLFRIAPLFFALVIFHLWRDPSQLQLLVLLANASFVFNLFPAYHESVVWGGWTIGVEMIFYLMFPLIYRFVDDTWKAVVVVVACFVIAWIGTILLDHFSPANYSYKIFAIFLPVFTAGMLAFQVSASLKHHEHRTTLGVALIALALISLTAFLNYWDTVFDHVLFFDRWALAEQALIFSTFLIGLMLAPVAVFVNRVTIFLGKISYSLYLIHLPLVFYSIPLYQWIYNFPLNRSMKFAACIAVTFCMLVPICYLTYRCIEEPGIQLGKLIWRRLSVRRESRIVAG